MTHESSLRVAVPEWRGRRKIRAGLSTTVRCMCGETLWVRIEGEPAQFIDVVEVRHRGYQVKLALAQDTLMAVSDSDQLYEHAIEKTVIRVVRETGCAHVS